MVQYAARRSGLHALRAQASRAPCAQAYEPRLRPRQNVCYYNVKPGPALKGYSCTKPVPGWAGAFEECTYVGLEAAAT